MNNPFVTGPYQAEPPPNAKLNGVELTLYGKACVESFLRGLSPKSLKILCKESKHQPLDPESFRQSLLQGFRGGRELPRPVLDRLKARLSLDGLLKSFGESFHLNALPAWIRLFGFGHTELAIVLDGRSETSSLLTVMQRLRPDQIPNMDGALDILIDSICDALLPLKVEYALKFLGYTGKFNPQLGIDPVEEIAVEHPSLGSLVARAAGTGDSVGHDPRRIRDLELPAGVSVARNERRRDWLERLLALSWEVESAAWTPTATPCGGLKARCVNGSHRRRARTRRRNASACVPVQ